ncbi:hypothetical protein PC119_g10887 [Phytophthora cactorum]|nr:hypothetical protein PC119_g10887 [Phytophthora cactorum]KAG3145999.1 hypothetical protein C6341_g18176 [Phytophthora cactorum]
MIHASLECYCGRLINSVVTATSTSKTLGLAAFVSSLCPQEKLSPCSRPCPFRKPGALAAMATHMSTGRSYHLTGRRSKLSEIP